MTHVRMVTVCMAMATVLPAGTVVKSKYTADGKTSNMTVYSSPGKQRVDMGDSKTIQQCETKRYVQVDEKTKTFIVVPAPTAPAAPTPDQAAAACTNKPVAADTGERKQMLGLTAQRWKTTLEGCDGTKMEIDGYYAGFEYAVSCDLAPAFSTGAPGSPLAYNITTTDKAGKSNTVSYVVEGLELTSGPLESSIFDIPGEAKETSIETAQAVRNPDFIEAVAAPKPAVPNRVGVATAGGKGTMDVALVKMLKDAKVDAVPLGSGPDAEIQARAEQAKADYVLMIEVGELKPGGTNKAAGFLSKASSLASGAAERQAYNATINYTMMSLGGSTPKLAASAVGSTTQFGLKEAIALGRVASMFTPMGMMMRPGMGGMMPFMMQMGMSPGGMAGGYGTGMGLPALMRSVDPGMMMMQPAVQASLQAAGSLGGESQENAVSSALEKVSKAVAISLHPSTPDAKAATGKPAKGKKKK
ncbi:MAG: hypothetical protein ABI972_06175 [Acidobacteriota bacterium]